MQISFRQLFFAFFQIGVMGFGSTVVYAHRVVVEDWRWMTEEEFLDTWSVCQLLPGPNMVNWAVCAGARFRGKLGALVAVLGLVVAPVTMVLTLAVLYAAFGDLPAVNSAFRGIAAVAAGLLIATSFKMAATPRIRSWMVLFAVLAFLAAGVARLSLILVLGLLIPLSIAASWLRARAERT